MHDSTHKFEEAFKIMHQASQIFIMGFGFEDTTFDQLRMPDLTGRQIPIISSSYGLSRIIKARVHQKFEFSEQKIEFFPTQSMSNILVDMLNERLG